MALTDVRIRQAKPTEKTYRLADSGGLFLEVRPNGNKFWRYAYRIDKKQNLFAVGTYPAVTLQQAREEHTKARALVKSGLHPARERTRTKQSVIKVNRETFKAIAEEWFESKRSLPAEGRKKAQKGWSEEYEGRIRRHLNDDIYPRLGNLPIRLIQTADVAAVISSVEKRGAPTSAILVRQLISQVFYHGISDGLADYDPTYVMRRRGTRKRAKVLHKKPLRPDGIETLAKRLREVKAPRPRVIAIQLLLLLFVRTKELRTTTWAEILPALKTSLWVIPEDRMKMGRIHLVPLPTQAITLLKELHTLTGDGEYLFPHRTDQKKPMGPDAVNYVLEKMGYGANTLSGHGFRATASTLLNELGYREEHVDMQLAHSKEETYNQARYLPERTEMMHAWATLLDRMGRGEDVKHCFAAKSVPLQLAA